MLAAVLWLGNISFEVIDDESHVEAVADEGKPIALTFSSLYLKTCLLVFELLFHIKNLFTYSEIDVHVFICLLSCSLCEGIKANLYPFPVTCSSYKCS